MAFGQIRAINSSLVIRVPAPSPREIRTSRARLPSRTGLSPCRSSLCFTYNRKGPNENTGSSSSLESIPVMLSAEFESDKRETRAEFLRYTDHGFPSAPNAQKNVPGG